MSDASTPAPSSPAAAPSATPTPAAGGTPPVHHAHLQPREQGKFAGPPDASKATPAPSATPETPPAPKKWKLGEREFTNPDDLHTYAAEKDAEARGLSEWQKRAIEASAKAREAEERLKDPRKMLTPELRQQILREEIEAFREQEALKAMPEDQRRLYLFAKEQERKAKELEAKFQEHEAAEAAAKKKSEEEAQAKAEAEHREEIKAVIGGALHAVGLATEGLAGTFNVQRAALVMAGAAQRGVVYPPEVVAAKVKAFVDQEQTQRLSSMDVPALLKTPGLVEKLNGLEDASLLRLLAPLGEKLRRLNLEALGATPAPAAPPVATGAAPAGMPPDLKPGDPRYYETLFKLRAKGLA